MSQEHLLDQRVLVHNIGHHDVYFDLYERPEEPVQGGGERVGWCKPKGSAVSTIGADLYSALSSGAISAIADECGGYTLSPPLALTRCDPDELRRKGASLPWQWGETLNELRTPERLSGHLRRPLEVRRLYLPLLHAVLLHHEGPEPEPYALTLLLVTAGARGGVDPQTQERQKPDATSPEDLARSIELLVRLRWRGGAPSAEREVRCCHANTDSRELDASALRVFEEPILAIAGALAAQHAEGWRDHLRVSLSASTGTPNMLSALTLTLSEWKPTLYTISKALQPLQCTPDAPNREYNPKSSPMSAISDWVNVRDEQLDPVSALAVQELRRWRLEYLDAKPERPEVLKRTNKEACFFHRKGLKEVLCVVVVRDREGSAGERGALLAVRGVNLEVSLPTGTLCAERNAIGTALCLLPALERRDICAVAVLSLDPALPNLGPCGACQEWLKKVIEVNPKLRIISFADTDATRAAVRPALTV